MKYIFLESNKMTMHLAHPAISLNGKYKGKFKFKNAKQAKEAKELAALWEENQNKWKSMSKVQDRGSRPLTRPLPSLAPPPGREAKFIPSLDTGIVGAVSSKQSQKYTGTKIIGIGTMHKSNAVPIFSDEEAQDISKMRR